MSKQVPRERPGLQAWVSFLRAHAGLTRSLNADLVQTHGLTLNDYEVLLHLARAPDHQLRRVDLAERLLLTASGITRLLDGLERSGCVTTGSCETDARGTSAVSTDEGVARLREMYGVKLRPEGPYLQDATPDTLTNFCNGIGDLNPLYRDVQHGRYTRWGSQLGHPCFPYAFGWPGRTRWGLPGVHGFYAGNDWEFCRPIRPGDRVNCVERVVGVEE